MNNNDTIYSSFKFNWVVKSISFVISYKKAYKTTIIDEVFCSIVDANNGQIDKTVLGELLGFNLLDNPIVNKYKDIAEEDIFTHYLNRVLEFDLLKKENDIIFLTEYGKTSLATNLKFEYLYANTEVFENASAIGEKEDFPFEKVFNINSKTKNINKKEVSDYEIIEDSSLNSKLKHQLFNNDIFKGKIINIYDNQQHLDYHEFELQCQLIEYNETFQIRILDKDRNVLELDELIKETQNTKFYEELIHKGKFQHLVNNENTILGSNELSVYSDLWNWKEIPQKHKVNWHELEIFELFKDNGDGSVWESISEHIELDALKQVIDKYSEYWNWRILTKRLDNNFILNTVDDYRWNFEEISYKETKLVSQLLSNDKFVNESWDWEHLTEELSNEFIIENINRLPWNFYQLTTSKFDVFKTVFNKDAASHLKKSWNWKYISEEIKIEYLYRNVSVFSNRIDWDIVLNRFFNDNNILQKCISDNSFKALLKNSLPEIFKIDHQNYIWSIQVISFFDELGLINWETHAFIKGFDTNENVSWDKFLFEKYSSKVKTESGYSNVSKQIEDKSLLLDFSDFPWDWNSISQNQLLISDTDFLLNYHDKLNWQAISSVVSNDIISQHFFDFPWNIEQIEKRDKGFLKQLIEIHSPFEYNFNWGAIYSLFSVSFWNEHLKTFVDKTSIEDDSIKIFWDNLTKDSNYNSIISKINYPWNWSLITEDTSPEVIIESFDNELLLSKWDWIIATRKLERVDIFDYLEAGTSFWDWQYLIKEVFTTDDLTLDENGELIRIATCISTIDSGIKNESWKELTSVFSIEELYNLIEATSDYVIFEWDWDYISEQKHIPTDLLSLNKFANKFNWSILPENEAIQKKFAYSSWGKDKKGCFETILKYLTQFSENWDWKVLSKNKDINWDRRLLNEFKNRNWDWDYLSENGAFLKQSNRDKDNYLINLLRKYPINFDLFSKREDIKITSEAILGNRSKNWNFGQLSNNKKAEITTDLLLQLSDKDWNWEFISSRNNIVINNEIIIELKDKDWNWVDLANRTDLDFNNELIHQTSNKPWDWVNISRNKSFNPSIETLSLTKTYDLDWEYISQRKDLKPTRELLAKFEDKLIWLKITRHVDIDFENIDFINRFISKWDWNFISENKSLKLSTNWLNAFKEHLNWSPICKSGSLTFDEKTLNTFAKYLDWNLISENTNIEFTKELILKYESNWNWNKLKYNNRIIETLGNFVQDTISSSANLKFLSEIEEQYSPWRGYIYHFTHIDNAVEIIKNKKIQSRNKANIKGDAAGNVVHLRNDAHDYARFYFRPKTPTQFYNEFLGKNTNDGYYNNKTDIWFSWYERARGLGFPKCPIPIFFRFTIKEVLYKNLSKCCISDGNMQTRSTSFGSLESMVNKFGFNDLFYTPEKYATKDDYNRYRDYSQQEFLVKNELSFDDLFNYEIICQSHSDKELLINLIGDENSDVLSKIIVNDYLYNNENPRINVRVANDKTTIDSHFNGEGHLRLIADNEINQANIIGGDVEQIKNEIIIFKSHLELINFQENFKVTFIDESNREWFIYKNIVDNISVKKANMPLSVKVLSIADYNPQKIIDYFKNIGYANDYITQVRHYTVERHTILVSA